MKICCLAHVIQVSIKKMLDTINGFATNGKMTNHWEDNLLDEIGS